VITSKFSLAMAGATICTDLNIDQAASLRTAFNGAVVIKFQSFVATKCLELNNNADLTKASLPELKR